MFSGRGGRAILQQLQRETGGRAFFNSNGSPEQITQVISDASGYYLLAYAPAREFSDGKFHRIDVRVRGENRNVVARNGYWAPTAEEMCPSTARPLEPAVAAALSALAAPSGGRPANVWIGTSRAGAERTRITVSWEPADATDARRPVQMTVEPLDGTTLESIGEPRPLASASPPSADAVAISAGMIPSKHAAMSESATSPWAWCTIRPARGRGARPRRDRGSGRRPRRR